MASLVVEKEAGPPGRDILIVFDIDETLIQFINKGPYPFWTGLSEEHKRVIDNNIEYTEERVGVYDEKIKVEVYNKLKIFYKKDVEKLEKFLGYKVDWF